MGQGKWIAVLVFAVNIYFNPSVSGEEIITTSWTKIPLDEVTAPEAQLGVLGMTEETVRSVIACASSCISRPQCSVFCFNNVTSACAVNTDVAVTSSVTLGEADRCFRKGRCPYSDGYTTAMQGGYCVKVYKSNVSRSEASVTCARDGGHLYKVGSVEDKQVFADPKVTGQFPSRFLIWVGAIRDPINPSTFVWTDGTTVPLGPTFWKTGEPNNFQGIESCVLFLSDSPLFGLNDYSCTYLTAFMCQVDLPVA